VTIASAFSASFLRSETCELTAAADRRCRKQKCRRSCSFPDRRRAYGDIDKEHGLFLRSAMSFSPCSRLKMKLASRCGNHDVGAIAGFVKPAEFDGLPVEFLR